eukprot:TRINITY_DN28631_c0_g1_i2.p1 TRINITY_DN28631_c0_g1~~TRINITY_DN28631_c0_g1_i2.p1  ORF type:complete len:407 (-),score=56.19 TRINITY_DN28631_c0_g1_i2:587-1807(-)
MASLNPDVLSALDAFAFGTTSEANPSEFIGATCVSGASSRDNSSFPSPEATVDKKHSLKGSVASDACVVHLPAPQAEEALVCDEQSMASKSSEPALWRKQFDAILNHGARGTVEDFHEFLVSLTRVVGTGRAHAQFVGLCAAMLSAQTKDHVTLAAIRRLSKQFNKGDDGLSLPLFQPTAVAEAPLEVLEECLRGVNFYKTKAAKLRSLAATILQNFGGEVPHGFDELCSLPGVGPKVANLVKSVTLEEVEDCGMVVDTHVHRVALRLGWRTAKDATPEHTRRRLEQFVSEDIRELVTRRLIGFGQEVCLPRRPRCSVCPLAALKLCPSAATATNSVAPSSSAADEATGSCGDAPQTVRRAFRRDLSHVSPPDAKKRLVIELDARMASESDAPISAWHSAAPKRLR